MEELVPAKQKDDFGLKATAELITTSAFAETDKVRQAGLLSGNLIAKMMKDRPAFKAMVLEQLTTFKNSIEDYYKSQLDETILALSKASEAPKPTDSK